jgi:hypothetical protein
VDSAGRLGTVAESAHKCKDRCMQNPDQWQPPDPEPAPAPPSRRGALVGLVFILLLVIGGWLLSRTLRDRAHFQDCVLAGRTYCG